MRLRGEFDVGRCAMAGADLARQAEMSDDKEWEWGMFCAEVPAPYSALAFAMLSSVFNHRAIDRPDVWSCTFAMCHVLVLPVATSYCGHAACLD
eukprot:984387-Rhodomonas_salina.1